MRDRTIVPKSDGGLAQLSRTVGGVRGAADVTIDSQNALDHEKGLLPADYLCLRPV